jgi:hypothetical protein
MIFVKILIALIGFFVFRTLIPALLTLLSVQIPPAGDTVITLLLACTALWYIIWGPNPRWPTRV